jgi:monosaccharide-transporting ATPase
MNEDHNNNILQMKGIYKSFPGVKALKNVDFSVRKGEIHALLGENGAGKSTLIKVLTGVETLDEGEVYLDGNRILAKSPQHAQELGISTVYQEVNLCPNLSVAENIFLGREPVKFGRINWQEINHRSEAALARLNVKLDVTKRLGEYPVAIQQMVAISRSLDISAKVLILDEPTSSLDKVEVNNLFTVMRKLKEEGIAIVFVSHFLNQVYEVTDRLTILRNGELVGSYETAKLPLEQLVVKMIGKEFENLDQSLKQKNEELSESKKDEYYKALGVGRKGAVEPFDIEFNRGEVMGLVGLLGSGRTETARIIFGIDKTDSGEVFINKQKTNINSPQNAIKIGMGYCPENRKTEGIIGDLSIRENIILALQGKRGLGKYLSRREQEKIADQYIKLLNISTPSAEQLVKNLSGGNQQKVILARWLATEPDFLILDEPTRGIDIGAKAEIQKKVIELAEKGMSILFISSEFEEMVRCCSRMAVFRDKVKLGELSGNEISEQKIMQKIAEA